MMLMIVGEENVGKTTLVRSLVNMWDPTSATTVSVRSLQRTGDTMSTDGVDITRCKFKYDLNKLRNTGKSVGRDQSISVDVSMWDFAGELFIPEMSGLPRTGQEVYYTTHQFFLLTQSIFIVVFNLTKPMRDSRVDFWLHSISSKVIKVFFFSRAQVSDPKVFIVGTHMDKLSEKQKSRVLKCLSEF